MSAYIQTNQTIQLPDSDYTVSSVDTGKIFLISADGPENSDVTYTFSH